MKMKEIADLANVSTSTVSRVLTRPEMVNAETREKVMQVIEEMQYKPNLVARQFRTQETRLILVIVPDIASGFFSEVLHGIEKTAFQHGYKVLLCDTTNNIQKEKEYLNLLQQKQVDGAVLLTAKLGEAELKALIEDFPIVLACEYTDNLDIPTVTVDNIESSKLATEHLIDKGHTKIAHITGKVEGVLGRDRYKGCKMALAAHGIEFNGDFVRIGDTTLKTGYSETLSLLRLKNRPTALFAFNDETAYGAIKAINEQGLRIPEDIAIVGFDDLDFSEVVTPPLTSIRQPRFEMGEAAMNLLMQSISGEKVEQRRAIMPHELIVRKSSGK